MASGAATMVPGMCGNCFKVSDPGATSRIEPIEASVKNLKNGHWCTGPKNGQPGIISNVRMSKTGKHGHAKFTFNLQYPFTEQTSQEMWPGHTHLKRPVCRKYELEMMNWDNEENGSFIIDLQDDNGEEYATYMHPDYVNKNGDPVGQNLVTDWDAVQAELDSGNFECMLMVSLMEAPVIKKEVFFIRQIQGWNIKGSSQQ